MKLKELFTAPQFIALATTGVDDHDEMIGLAMAGAEGEPQLLLRSDMTEAKLQPAARFHGISEELCRSRGEELGFIRETLGRALGDQVLSFNSAFQQRYLNKALGYMPAVTDITRIISLLQSRICVKRESVVSPIAFASCVANRQPIKWATAMDMVHVTPERVIGVGCVSRVRELQRVWQRLAELEIPLF